MNSQHADEKTIYNTEQRAGQQKSLDKHLKNKMDTRDTSVRDLLKSLQINYFLNILLVFEMLRSRDCWECLTLFGSTCNNGRKIHFWTVKDICSPWPPKMRVQLEVFLLLSYFPFSSPLHDLSSFSPSLRLLSPISTLALGLTWIRCVYAWPLCVCVCVNAWLFERNSSYGPGVTCCHTLPPWGQNPREGWRREDGLLSEILSKSSTVPCTHYRHYTELCSHFDDLIKN